MLLPVILIRCSHSSATLSARVCIPSKHSLLSRYARYEVARGQPPKDATYFANAHVLLHDDTCFRFASLPGNQVSFQMMDPDKSEVPAGAPAVHGFFNLSPHQPTTGATRPTATTSPLPPCRPFSRNSQLHVQTASMLRGTDNWLARHCIWIHHPSICDDCWQAAMSVHL
jgi:hypothetical protein